MIDDSFFWFRRNRLTLPGVKGEHLLMHISDTHLNVTDELSTPEERAESEKQEAMWAVFKEKFARGQLDFAKGNDEPYGDAQRISTVEAFEKQLALAGELKPEALLLSDRILIYSERPARILEEIPVPFARPRKPDLRDDPAFLAMTRELRGKLFTK